MIFGMLPLALGLGAGAEMRAPMARAVIGGLITSTLLTLLVVPVVYTLLDDLAGWIRRRWNGKAAATAVLAHRAPRGGRRHVPGRRSPPPREAASRRRRPRAS